MITKKAIEGASEVTVIVETSISGDTGCRMKENRGCGLNIKEMRDRIDLHLTKEATVEFAHIVTLQSVQPCW